MTENEIEPNQYEIDNINIFINLMLKAIFFGVCFILIIVPLHIIFG